MFINRDLQIGLLEEACRHVSGMARINLHKSRDSNIQLMVIAFSPNKVYEYICDDITGLMSYTCLLGEMEVCLIERDGNERCVALEPGNVFSLPRNIWRRTRGGEKGCTFLECIEGRFLREKRRRMVE